MVFDIRSSGAAFAPAGARAPAPWPIALRTTGAQAPVLAPDGAHAPAIPAVALCTDRCSSSGPSVLRTHEPSHSAPIGAQAPAHGPTALCTYRCSSSGPWAHRTLHLSVLKLRFSRTVAFHRNVALRRLPDDPAFRHTHDAASHPPAPLLPGEHPCRRAGDP